MPEKKTNEQWLAQAMECPHGGEYRWLSQYINCKTKIQYQHACGYIVSIRPDHFLNGHGCPVCAFRAAGDSLIAKTKAQHLEMLKDVRDTVIEYKSASKVVVKCRFCGKLRETSVRHLANGNECMCQRKQKTIATSLERYGVESPPSRNREQWQIDITENPLAFSMYVKRQDQKPTPLQIAEQLGYSDSTVPCKLIKRLELKDFVVNDTSKSQAEKRLAQMFGLSPSCKAIPPYEIDAYDPDRRVGIEFNGVYWHSTKKKPANYHDQKSRLAAEKGIRLIHIWEHEWANRREQCIRLIENALGRSTVTVGARKCEVDTNVPSAEYMAFMEAQHIQGACSASVRLGLRHKGELVMAVGLKKEGKGYNLVRMASSCNVVGGASRLAKYLPDGEIVTFCDTGKFTGGVYEKMGFQKVGEVEPRYVWVHGSALEVKSRRACQKQNICQCPEDWAKTEVELMSERGYYQCYGCHMDKYRFISPINPSARLPM